MADPIQSRAVSPLGTMARRAWRHVALFLEVIGLRHPAPPPAADHVARFRLYHTEFRTLIAANDSFLKTVSELEQALHAPTFFDASFVTRRAVRALADVHRMVASLEVISAGRHGDLRGAIERIGAEVSAAVAGQTAAGERLVLDLGEVTATDGDLAGGKMANLGELRNAVGLATPDGFVATTEAYQRVLRDASTRLDGGEPGAADDALAELLRTGSLPPAVGEAIHAAFDRLAARLGRTPRLAVRSSALGEDGRRSFAGQFLTVLNVDRAGLLAAYREVVASLHSPEAAAYRRLHGIEPGAAAMAVGFVEMVDGGCAGIAYSVDPGAPADGRVRIEAVRGLGVTLADGGSAAETVLVERGSETPRVDRVRARQTHRADCDAAGGVREEAVDEAAGAPICLDDADAARLARWAQVLEAHFGGAQDIEWARGRDGQLALLQCRPLRLPGAAAARHAPAAGATVLLAGGEAACPGVGRGVAVRLDEDDDIESFPDGGVLIARRSSPRFVRLMARAGAIVTDAGSVTGHMASLAREFGVPTLVDTRTATRDVPAGAEVTVDAGAGLVYLGQVPGLEPARPPRASGEGDDHPLRGTHAHALLGRVVDLLAPLNLTDPRARDFAPEACRTLHDVARFVHEKSYEEMFRLGEDLGDARAAAHKLDVFLPIDLYVVDLGGGVRAPAHGARLKPGHVTSTPLAAFLRGTLDRRLPRFGPKPIDVGGFLSVMMRHALTSPETDQTFRDPSYAIVSDAYLNFTARVGYHFAVVDSYCGPNPNRNYIGFRFKGGAADKTRRHRRVRAIAGILREHGFFVELTGDMVRARMGKAREEDIVARLEMLGRLMQFFRQMDVAMVSDESVDRFKDAFLRDDFSVLGTGDPPPGQT